jgi:hypothetical protein
MKRINVDSKGIAIAKRTAVRTASLFLPGTEAAST